MTDRQRQILIAARERAARARDRWEPEPAWQPMLELVVPAGERTAHRYKARGANTSMFVSEPETRYRDATSTIH